MIRRGRSERERAAEHDARVRIASAESTAARLRAVLDALPLGVIVVDGAGTEVERNAEAARLVAARGSDALAARALTDLVLEATTAPAARIVELHGPPARTLSIAASPLATGDAGRGAVAVVQDVTERHRLDAVRRDFVANVSHELRTPIGALTALADTLNAEDEPEVMRRLAARIASEAERAGNLIDDLLDLSRLESGEVDRRPVPVRVLVDRAIDRVSGLAADRSIGLRAAASIPDEEVLVDTVQVVSALTNLLENGVKYSEVGTEVVLTASVAGEAVVFEVRDQGIGIPPADRDRIFERFYRVDPARSRATGGTGLGLAIVRHVARNHGGDVMVESREGEGSTFSLRLPQPEHVAVGGAA